MENTDKRSSVKCNPHPDAPHGFMRDASHSAGRYVCECESWEEPKQQPVGYVSGFYGGYCVIQPTDPSVVLPVGTALYRAPTEWVGLTDEEKEKLVEAFYGTDIQRLEAVELRRLHEVNQDLLKALNTILNICLLDNGHWSKTIEREAHEAIAKATGEKA